MINQRKLMFKKNIVCELNFQPNAKSVIYVVVVWGQCVKTKNASN